MENKNEAETGIFDYDRFRALLGDVELSIFFSNNEYFTEIESKPLNNKQSEYNSMIDWLYRKALDAYDASSGDENPRCDHLKNRNGNKQHNAGLERSYQQSIEMFWNSQAICMLFRNFFTLVDFHPSAVVPNEYLRESYLRVIFKLFGSLEKKCLTDLFSMACTSSKMYEFYSTLYSVWECESDAEERKIVLSGIL